MNDTIMQGHAFRAQVVVMRHEQYTVSGSDTEQGDESDDGRNADNTRCKPNT